jgi:proteasome lid subunit RPN8/RPN11
MSDAPCDVVYGRRLSALCENGQSDQELKMIRVIARPTDWNGFIRRAKKAFPTEHCEALWGDVTVDGFRITKFSVMKTNAVEDGETTVDYDDAELHRQMHLATVAGVKFIGTVHTHPDKDFDTAASAIDHHLGSSDGERIMGVVVLYKNDKNKFVVKTDWWIPQPRIAFELTE